ncbi:MAG TPA: hypothetical protein VI731_09005 [Bacteroidia bacterium]|nr:hypothetical protein [Bacteroidia bacterium]
MRKSAAPRQIKSGRTRLFFSLLFLIFSKSFNAQSVIWQRLSEGNQFVDFFVNNAGLHTAIKPFLNIDLNNQRIPSKNTYRELKTDTLDTPQLTWMNYYKKPDRHDYAPGRKNEWLIRPVYDLMPGYEFSRKRILYSAAAGFILNADCREKLGIELRFVPGMTALPSYQDSIAKFSGAIPGWGDRAYPMGNGKYSFQHFSGNIIWRPGKVFNLQLGRDKHFWGEGHRSLFLSDLSAAFPYIKQQTTIWRLQYTSLFAWLQDWTNAYGPTGYSAKNFRSKFATFHYISFNAAKWLNLGLFESVIWQGTDNNRSRGFDPNYLNPMVFFRPVEYSLGSSDNAMLGFAMKIRFNSNNIFYSQIFLDEFFLKEIRDWSLGWWANKQGMQLGYKCFNFGRVKNLFMQTELSIVRPYTYSHGSPQQSYSNGGFALAHPMGANFAELIGMLSWSFKRLIVSGKLVGARYGLDSDNYNYGQDIFKSYTTRTSTGGDPDYGHKIFDGVGTNLFYAELRTSYRFNTAFPLRVELIAGSRAENNILTRKKSTYLMAGLSLPLWRSHRDF